MKNEWDDSEDKRKERERKERIQHPHHIKSKSHWGWDAGYDMYEEEEKKKDE
tara:strand:- start:582 stop:737 length:156 start_codon:yes stop_codon:yes gene_type:complete